MLKYKWMYMAVLCCAMFVACEPTEETSNQNPISFGSGRKQALNTINARLWGYTTSNTWVFGSATTGENAEYIETEETLTPDVVRYWADNQTYNFYSVWPVVDGNGISNIAFDKSNSQLSFSADISNQNENTDFCIAAKLGEQGGTDRTAPVQMIYKHALAKVQFRGFSSTSISAKLTELTITVPKSATAVCTLSATTEENVALPITYTLGTETQALTQTGTTYTLPANPDKSTAVTPTDVAEWLVFPQTIVADQITISATYILGDGTDETQTKTVSTSLPIDQTTTWQPGKRYIYDFYIQPSGPITFGTFKILDWEDTEDNRDEIDLR